MPAATVGSSFLMVLMFPRHLAADTGDAGYVFGMEASDHRLKIYAKSRIFNNAGSRAAWLASNLVAGKGTIAFVLCEQ